MYYDKDLNGREVNCKIIETDGIIVSELKREILNIYGGLFQEVVNHL